MKTIKLGEMMPAANETTSGAATTLETTTPAAAPATEPTQVAPVPEPEKKAAPKRTAKKAAKPAQKKVTKVAKKAAKVSSNKIEAAIQRALTSFIKAAPKRHTCPKCEKSRKTADSFGFRVMNRPAVISKGAAPIVRMQSQCKTCRGGWKK